MIMHQDLRHLFDDARPIQCPAGKTVFRTGDAVREMFLVRTGSVLLQRHSTLGATLTLANATEGMILAEASAYSDAYHCDAIAGEVSLVLVLPKSRFRNALAHDATAAEAWASMLARQVQAARMRAEIRSLPKVADRLDAWFDAGHGLPEKGSWQDLAAELSVTREALYRELARRRAKNPSA